MLSAGQPATQRLGRWETQELRRRERGVGVVVQRRSTQRRRQYHVSFPQEGASSEGTNVAATLLRFLFEEWRTARTRVGGSKVAFAIPRLI